MDIFTQQSTGKSVTQKKYSITTLCNSFVHLGFFLLQSYCGTAGNMLIIICSLHTQSTDLKQPVNPVSGFAQTSYVCLVWGWQMHTGPKWMQVAVASKACDKYRDARAQGET